MTAPLRLPRATWTELPDPLLLAQCDVDTYRASGPGGQKRNKTSSAVRLRHSPTGLLVIAEESRSQHENKAKALIRIRQAIYLQWRDPIPNPSREMVETHSAVRAIRDDSGRLPLRAKDPRFWPAVGIVLDLFVAAEAQVRLTADWLAVSTAHLVDFCQVDPKVWQTTNRLRVEFQKPLLRSS